MKACNPETRVALGAVMMVLGVLWDQTWLVFAAILPMFAHCPTEGE